MSWIATVLLATAVAASQLPPADQATGGLEAGVAQVRKGDSLLGLITLNDALPALQGADLARAHAYRAEAFLALKEPQRARTAVIQALGANPAFSVDGADFTDALRQLFAEVRGTRPAVAVPTAAAVPAATGNIHVYSPTQNFLGQSAKIKIECNGRRVAELQNDRVLTIRAEPGAHQIKVHRTTLTVTVAAGADQYVRASLRAFGANVTEVPAAKATAEIEQRTVGLSDTTPECRVPSTAKKPK